MPTVESESIQVTTTSTKVSSQVASEVSIQKSRLNNNNKKKPYNNGITSIKRRRMAEFT